MTQGVIRLVVVALLGVTPRADEQAALGRDHLEHRLRVVQVVLIPLGTLE